MPLDKLFDKVTEALEGAIGPRHSIELSVLVLLACGSVFVVSHSITKAAVLAASLWVPVGLLYFWTVYRKRFRPSWERRILALAIVLSGGWALWLGQFLTYTHREIVQDMNAGQEYYRGREYSNASEKFAHALNLAQTSGNSEAQAESLLSLAHTEFVLAPGKPEQFTLTQSDYEKAYGLTKDARMKAQIRIAQASLDNYAGQSDHARQRLSEAMEFAEKLKSRDRLLEATILGAQGDVENKALNRESALRYYRKADELYAEKSGRIVRWQHALFSWILGDHAERDARRGQAEILVDSGDLEIKVGNLRDARKDYDDASNLFHQVHDGREEAYALVGVASVDALVSKYEDARNDFKAAQGLYVNDRQGQADVYFNLGELERTLGNNVEASSDYQNALNLYGDKDDQDRVNVFVGRAELATVLGNYKLADDDLKAAESLVQPANEPLGKMTALEARAELYNQSVDPNKIAEARRDYDTLRSFYDGFHNQLGEANVLLDLGRWESRFGDPKEARDDYGRAYTFFQAEEVPIGEADVLFSEGELERQAKNYDPAISDYEAALKIYESDSRNICKVGQANVLLGLGEVARVQGRPKEAREDYDKARGLYGVQQSQIGRANVDLAEGMLSDTLEKPEERKANLNEARDLYSAMGRIDKVHEAALQLNRR